MNEVQERTMEGREHAKLYQTPWQPQAAEGHELVKLRDTRQMSKLLTGRCCWSALFGF